MSRPHQSSARLRDLLNLTCVPRWSVVPMHRSQSVAEHSHRCAAISLEILSQLSETDSATCLAVLKLALSHDAPESFSGDIPSPFKQQSHAIHGMLETAGFNCCPWLQRMIDGDEDWPPIVDSEAAVVHLADLIEGYTWWVMFRPEYWNHPWAVNRTAILLEKVKSAAEGYATKFDWPTLPAITREICHAILRKTEGGNGHAEAEKIVAQATGHVASTASPSRG